MEKPRSWNISLQNEESPEPLSPVEQIDLFGYTVIPDLIDSSYTQACKAECIRLHHSELDNGGEHAIRTPHLVANNLVPRSRVFDGIILNSALLSLVEHYYGEHVNLLELRALNLTKCNEIPFMHKDSMTNTVPGSPLRLVCILALEQTDSTNGATFVVPGSHHFPFKPTPANARYVETKIISLKAGSGLVFDANLWHGPSPNFSGNSRWTLSLTYGHWFIKPQYNWITLIPEDTFDCLPLRLKSLLGYNSRSPIDCLTRMGTTLTPEYIKFDAT